MKWHGVGAASGLLPALLALGCAATPAPAPRAWPDVAAHVAGFCTVDGGARLPMERRRAPAGALLGLELPGSVVARAGMDRGYGTSRFFLEIVRDGVPLASAHTWSDLYHPGSTRREAVRARLPAGLSAEAVEEALAPLAERRAESLGLQARIEPGRRVECELTLRPPPADGLVDSAPPGGGR